MRLTARRIRRFRRRLATAYTMGREFDPPIGITHRAEKRRYTAGTTAAWDEARRLWPTLRAKRG